MKRIDLENGHDEKDIGDGLERTGDEQKKVDSYPVKNSLVLPKRISKYLRFFL